MHHDATFLPLELATDDYAHGGEKIPALSASASRDAQGRVHLSLVNLDAKAAVAVEATVSGARPTAVSGRVLTADALDGHNTVDAPNRVQPAAFTGATLAGPTIEARLPPRSVVVLTLQAR